MKQIGQSLGSGVGSLYSSFYFWIYWKYFIIKKCFSHWRTCSMKMGVNWALSERGIQAYPPVRSVSWNERIWSEETGISLPAASLFEVRRRSPRKGEPIGIEGQEAWLGCWMHHSHGYWNYPGWRESPPPSILLWKISKVLQSWESVTVKTHIPGELYLDHFTFLVLVKYPSIHPFSILDSFQVNCIHSCAFLMQEFWGLNRRVFF